jgi:hAT family C-terminal dimerisation region
MAKEVNNWFHNKVPDAQLIMSLPPIDFWNNLQNESPLLSCLAQFILSIAVQTATCERLLSTFQDIL